ncbi:hypothetical protein A8F94_20305 [Bacillus sp. FJAT-27225]|nr:hypothetical protein A8F94_20305 [Bacillus sp. FJAT-27225]
MEWKARSSFENAKNAFSPAVLFQGRLLNVLREQRDRWNPTDAKVGEEKKCGGDCPAPTSAGGPDAGVVL